MTENATPSAEAFETISDHVLLHTQNGVAEILLLMRQEIDYSLRPLFFRRNDNFAGLPDASIEACFDFVADSVISHFELLHHNIQTRDPDTMLCLKNFLAAHPVSITPAADFLDTVLTTYKNDGIPQILSQLNEVITDAAIGHATGEDLESRATATDNLVTATAEAFSLALNSVHGIYTEDCPVVEENEKAILAAFDAADEQLERLRNNLFPEQERPFAKPKAEWAFNQLRFCLETSLIDMEARETFLACSVLGACGLDLPVHQIWPEQLNNESPTGRQLAEVYCVTAGLRHHLMADSFFGYCAAKAGNEDAPLTTPEDPSYKAARKALAFRLDRSLGEMRETFLALSGFTAPYESEKFRKAPLPNFTTPSYLM